MICLAKRSPERRNVIMILKKEQLKVRKETDKSGAEVLSLSDLADFAGRNEKLRTFSLAELDVGGEVAYHVHEGEFESYYIISGNGIYNDNGTEIPISAGTVTFTPSGEGHGIKNTGSEKLVFIALIILD